MKQTTAELDNVWGSRTLCAALVILPLGLSGCFDDKKTDPPPVGSFDLAVSVTGSGSGSVTSSPAGIDCGSDCTETLAAESSITLNATPASGAMFTGWGGDCSGMQLTCIVSMTEARSVSASFTPVLRALSVTLNGTGSVTSAPAGINCGTDCSENYAHGSNVTLTASPGANQQFSGWLGACSGTTTTCTVAMTEARSVTATFAPIPAVQFTLTVSVTGSGSVSSTPAGISCATDCTESYASGQSVTLSATAAAGFQFSGWSGGTCSDAVITCMVTMSANQTVTATFISNSGAWIAPIGIPVPPFGISEIAPAAPNPWNAASTTNGGRQFYYVCPTCAGHTDSANPYGYPAKPRDTIPATLPAGSVVEVHGQIDANQSFTSQGTASNPVFVRGADYASRPKLTAGQGITGSYVILENLWWGPLDSADNDFGVAMYEGSDHIAIRNCEASGNLNRAGGFGLGSWGYSGSQSLSYVVIDNCNIHDIGDINSALDQDSHGVTANGSVDHLWVTNNQISYVSGDAMQLEAQQGRRDKIHHVYYGRNHSHHNKQTGGWIKHASDVIFSQNTIHDHRAGNSSFGQCTGFQYGPEYVWFLYNRLYSCDVGIGFASNDPPGDGQYAFAIGNIIHNIHASTTNPYNSGAIMANGGGNLYFVNNTIYDVDAGFNLPPGWTSVQLYNNIVSNRTSATAYDVNVESNTGSVTLQNNLFPASPKFYWSGATYTSLSAFQSGSGNAQNSLANDPQFTDPAGNNFTHQSTSPARNSGVAHSAYTTFFARYGIDISKDFTGAARPIEAVWDMGAHEFVPLP